jgi:hypothetical protein
MAGKRRFGMYLDYVFQAFVYAEDERAARKLYREMFGSTWGMYLGAIEE